MTQKIVALTRSCGSCLNYSYYSSGRYECVLVGETVSNKSMIAPFCPLVDFPSRIIADQAATIAILREPNKHGLAIAILSHIATKLKTTVGANYVVTLLQKDKEPVYLRYDYITEITTQPSVVHFVSDGKRYKLYPEGDKPSLSEEVTIEGQDKPLWRDCQLA